MFELLLFCLLIGAIAGILAGLFGIGGGLIIVPALAWLFGKQQFSEAIIMEMAVATSLATILVTSAASIYAHHRLGSIIWGVVRMLVPGIILGTVIGSLIGDYLPPEALRKIFLIYLFAAGLQMALELKPDANIIKFKPGVAATGALIIGAISAVLGIGGGTMTVPFLSACNFSMRNAVGISSACGLPIAIAGSVSYVLLGWHEADLPPWSIGYIYIPAFFGIVVSSVIFAPIGAKLANSLPTAKLKRYFSVLLLIIGIKLLG